MKRTDLGVLISRMNNDGHVSEVRKHLTAAVVQREITPEECLALLAIVRDCERVMWRDFKEGHRT